MMQVNRHHITIEASDRAGFIYALQTLRLALPSTRLRRTSASFLPTTTLGTKPAGLANSQANHSAVGFKEASSTDMTVSEVKRKLPLQHLTETGTGTIEISSSSYPQEARNRLNEMTEVIRSKNRIVFIMARFVSSDAKIGSSNRQRVAIISTKFSILINMTPYYRILKNLYTFLKSVFIYL